MALAKVFGCFGCCTRRAVDNVEVKNIPLAVAVKYDSKVPQIFNDSNYYDQFHWKYQAGDTKNDMALIQRPETDEDRILDLLLVMDCTGSMQSWIELCKRTLKDCIDEVKKQHQELEVRVAFVGYRDFSDKDDIFIIQDFTFDLDRVKGFISECRARGGGDIPEDIQGALHQGTKLSWRGNSIKMAYLCADSPCHGKQYHDVSDDYPNGNPANLMLEKLMREYSDSEIDLTVYCLTTQTKKMYEIMEMSYNQGRNNGEMKRIDLQKDISKANELGESYHKGGGVVEGGYYVSTVNDMNIRAVNHYNKRGW